MIFEWLIKVEVLYLFIYLFQYLVCILLNWEFMRLGIYANFELNSKFYGFAI